MFQRRLKSIRRFCFDAESRHTVRQVKVTTARIPDVPDQLDLLLPPSRKLSLSVCLETIFHERQRRLDGVDVVGKTRLPNSFGIEEYRKPNADDAGKRPRDADNRIPEESLETTRNIRCRLGHLRVLPSGSDGLTIDVDYSVYRPA